MAFVVSKGKTRNGKPIAFIDPSKPENKETFKHKDIFKKHGARWDKFNKVWFWWLGDTKDKWQFAFDRFIKPALEDVHKAEGATEDDSKAAIIASIDDIIQKVEGSSLAGDKENPEIKNVDTNEVKQRLKDFKEKLVNIENDEEFKNTIQAVVRFKNAQGHKMSFGNALLVFLQDPKATHVMGKGRWKDPYGRNVKEGSPFVLIYAPVVNPYKSKQVKQSKEDYAKKMGYKSFDELPAGAQDKFNVTNRGKFGNSFKLVPSYDIRYTEPIEGVEDKAADLDATKNIKWFNDDMISEEVRPVYEGLMNFAKKAGIDVQTVDPEKLGGARGVSKSGAIEIINNEGNDVGITKTLAHEIAHELLHQKYLKNKNKDYGQYFVGTAEGRGKVEQQAEIAAWAVLTAYGFDLDLSSMNYAILWGADSSDAMVKVFDGVTQVVNRLIDEINANISAEGKTEAEGDDDIVKASHITPEQLAGKLGMTDQLQKAKANNEVYESLLENYYKKVNYIIKG